MIERERERDSEHARHHPEGSTHCAHFAGYHEKKSRSTSRAGSGCSAAAMKARVRRKKKEVVKEPEKKKRGTSRVRVRGASFHLEILGGNMIKVVMTW